MNELIRLILLARCDFEIRHYKNFSASVNITESGFKYSFMVTLSPDLELTDDYTNEIKQGIEFVTTKHKTK